MNRSAEILSALAATLPEAQGTHPVAAVRKVAALGRSTGSSSSVTASAQETAALEASREAASLRNTTVLPRVESAGQAVRIKPRIETRYQRLRSLGRGAMGEVSLALDNDIGRTVAVKRLVAQASAPAGIARFIDEIHTVGQLEHPNIVPIHDVGVDEQGQLFFVMKHIDGETLESVLAKLEAGDPEYLARYSIDRRIEIFLGVLRALQCAHEKGVIHRDIKPANVMIGWMGEVVLMDWGVARVRPCSVEADESLGPQGQVIGTPAYMSPEQVNGDVRATDARSDLYSAAVLFHELLAVRHYLAHCTSVTQLMAAIFSEPFRYMRLVFIHHPRHPVPPAELLHLIVRGLAKDPADRFQSAEEMIRELVRIRDGRCRVSCPATLARRMLGGASSFVGRYPKLSPFVFYAVLLGLLACVFTTARVLLAGAS